MKKIKSTAGSKSVAGVNL